MQVGWLCSQWAYLEWLLEVAVKWFDGRAKTDGVPISGLACKARDLAPRKLSSKSDLDAMADMAKRVDDVVDERNLAVHGVRSVQPEGSVSGAVGRGKYKGKPQPLAYIRLRSLNDEVERLIGVIEPLLAEHGVIEGSGPIGGEKEKS